MKINYKKVMILFLYIFLVLKLSTMDSSSIIFKLGNFDKFVHLLEYFILGYLVVNVFDSRPKSLIVKLSLSFFLFLFPFIDEFIQSFSPGRNSDILDAFADIIGGFLGAFIRWVNFD